MQLSVNGSDIFVATGGRPFDPSLPAVVMPSRDRFVPDDRTGGKGFK